MKKDDKGQLLFLVIVVPPTPQAGTYSWHKSNVEFLKQKLDNALTKQSFLDEISHYGWKENKRDGSDFYIAT